jgi:predicted nucleotide-binding protein (sugar kinase/HSP70/actin superfamily)
MKIGVPKGLLYYKYHVFAETFFSEIGAEIIVSPNTNKKILDRGVSVCVDDACLPIKVFHGHIDWLKGKCDAILVPRFMTITKKRYICPMFCGLIEMVGNNLPGLPDMVSEPVYSLDERNLYTWAVHSARPFVKSKRLIKNAFMTAMSSQKKCESGYNQKSFSETVALIGHSYIVNDSFINMGLVKKLNAFSIGVITTEYVNSTDVTKYVRTLFKEPFWYFAQEYYGAAMHLVDSGSISGLIYISAFSCGIDSVVVELIRSSIKDFPFLILKIDEHTGEAALNTRIEAFADMLKRRVSIGNNRTKDGKYLPCSQGII